MLHQRLFPLVTSRHFWHAISLDFFVALLNSKDIHTCSRYSLGIYRWYWNPSIKSVGKWLFLIVLWLVVDYLLQLNWVYVGSTFAIPNYIFRKSIGINLSYLRQQFSSPMYFVLLTHTCIVKNFSHIFFFINNLIFYEFF